MKFNLNLASRRYVNKRALNYGFLIVFAVLFLFVAWKMNVLLTGNRSLQLNQQQLVETQRQLQKLRGGPHKILTSKEREKLKSEYVVAAGLLSQDAFRWTRLLDRMEKLLPEGVSLSGFTPDYKKKSLTLNGRATNLKKMRIFLDRLLKKGDFKEVFLKSHSRTKVRDHAGTERSAISFSLQLEGVF